MFYAKSVQEQNSSFEVLTKLCSKGTILCDARPVIGPSLVPVSTNTDHWLNREAHARLRLPNGFVLCIMRDVWCTVEQLVDAMSTVCPNDTAVLALRMLLDNVAIVAKQSARLDHFDGLSQAFSGGLCDAHSIGVGQCLVTNVVCLVEIAVEAAVEEGYVNVEDVAVFEDSLVRDAVADDFVY